LCEDIFAGEAGSFGGVTFLKIQKAHQEFAHALTPALSRRERGFS
jgi:hypothetical protein